MTAHDLHVPAAPCGGALALCHGANNDRHLPLMVRTAEAAAAAGFYALRFDFSFRQAGRAPDRSTVPESVADLLAAVTHLQAQPGVARVYLSGKSYGATIALEAVRQGMPAAGLVLWGMPLRGQGRAPSPERVAAARAALAHVPALIIAGSEDPLCPPADVRALIQGLPGASLHVIEGGEHSYRPAGGTARSMDEMVAEAVRVAVEWLRDRE